MRVEPRVVEFNSLVNDATGGTFDAMVFGFSMDTSMDLTAQFGSDSVEEGNFGAYKNPEVDRLMVEAMAKPQAQDAKPALDRIQQILHREQPVTFLWESQRLSAINRPRDRLTLDEAFDDPESTAYQALVAKGWTPPQ